MTDLKMKVWKNGTSGQKLVSIPTYSTIQAGDYVYITKVDERDDMRCVKRK